jgi:Protein of unknown function (DUF402)
VRSPGRTASLTLRPMPLSTWSNITVRDVQNGAVYFAWPFKVIEDGPRGLFLAQRPGAVGRVPRGYPDDRAKMLGQLSATAPDLVELTWARTVSLDLWSPGDWWSTRVFWDETDGKFLCYYVDFVRPFIIQGLCLDTLDLALDIVVAPDGRWSFKDVDEYEDLRRRGWIGDDDREGVERAKPTVVAGIESGRFPFDGSLLDWHWPAGLPVAALPAGWDH